MAKGDIREKIHNLKEEGNTVYSISRLNSYHNCPYGYYLTYHKHLKGVDNPYSIMGGLVHEGLEHIYNNEGNRDDMIDMYEEGLTKCDLMGINFPNQKIKVNWEKDMQHFLTNFHKIDKKILTEKGVVFNLNGVWLQGYIDAIAGADNGELIILDWKTSSKFTGDKLQNAGRQLLLYKEALEQTSNRKVGKIGWFMIKYVNVKYGKRTKMCSRRQWVKDISKLLITDLNKLDYDDIVIPLMVDEAIENNNLDNMPDEVKNKYKLEDCIVWYEPTEEREEEYKSYITNTVEEIESHNKTNEDNWRPVEINMKSEFFCKNLCSQRENCKYFKEYMNN